MARDWKKVRCPTCGKPGLHRVNATDTLTCRFCGRKTSANGLEDVLNEKDLEDYLKEFIVHLLGESESWFDVEVSDTNQLARHLAISLKEFVLIADGLTKVTTYSQAANSPEEAAMNDPMYDYSAVRELIIQAEAALDILKKMGGGDV